MTAADSFDLWRKRLGMVLFVPVFVMLWLAPLPVAPQAHRLAAVLGAVVVLWVSEAIPMAMTAFLGVAVATVLQVASPNEAFAPFADPLIFLFIGTFLLAQAIFVHGLDRRFALAILSLPGVGRSPARILAAFAGATCLISMWISNTATTAMMYPIGLSLLRFLEQQQPQRDSRSDHLAGFGALLLLSAAFASSIGGLATPVGTPPNLIGIGFIRRELAISFPFFSWMAVGLPIAVAMFAWLVFDFTRGDRFGGSFASGAQSLAAVIAAERRRLGSWSRGQINTVVAFGMTVVLWLVPGVAALIFGQDDPLYRQLITWFPEAIVALLGAGLLFFLPVDLSRHQFTLSWSDAIKIDWWIVFLYGGGIALGTLAFKTGLARDLGEGLTSLLGIRSGFALLVLSTVIATVLSETTSNTAAANMVVPVVIAFARSSGIDPLIPALGATMGASLGFVLPVSTPTNAIVYGSGRIPLTVMIRYGLVLDVAGVVLIVTMLSLLGLWIAPL
ncbi:MAG TPA: DASS family sodium-coupled anion symporter [Terriglobales bacterium]|nr:DASS family sodium-coupled anion symporter [Terriglobales bacterium]